ncbi:hypothetical protein [Pacificibacter marinus]|uniref:hypothetical protein n=1 Tax=Pacificibacter marinus TaxID=658057 RepID=UPI001C06CDDF|nr:hypothetical protein [Pacificibacter marinus]MBU2866433.1 hypothetical protein [Pacificibacter marinus]
MFDSAWSKLRYYASTFISICLLFGFIGYWGYDIRAGGSIGSSSRFILFSWAAEGAELLSDSYGHVIVGHGIMGLALAAAVGTCVWVWRTGFF